MSDQYYSASQGAKLYVGRATSNPLPADAADIFDEVPLLGQITPPPHEIASAFFSILNDTVKRSVGGKKADQTLEGDIVIDWSETVHQNMYADAQVGGGQKRNYRIVYPNTGARVLKFRAFLSKWAEEAFDSGQDAKEHRAQFTLALDGAITAV